MRASVIILFHLLGRNCTGQCGTFFAVRCVLSDPELLDDEIHAKPQGMDLLNAERVQSHLQMDTTARYTQVTTNIIREVMSPLEPAGSHQGETSN
jgi:hypothetical protein